MNEHDNEWSRRDAEEHIADLLDAAKKGPVQTIVDFDGNFEVRFLAPLLKPVTPGLADEAELAEPDTDSSAVVELAGDAPVIVEPKGPQT